MIFMERVHGQVGVDIMHVTSCDIMDCHKVVNSTYTCDTIPQLEITDSKAALMMKAIDVLQ